MRGASPTSQDIDVDRWLPVLEGRATVRAVARALAPAAIPVVPLKGVLLREVVYADPTARPMRDVDLLVPEAAWQRAVAVLTRSGFEPVWLSVGGQAMNLSHPGGPAVDLHRRLFGPGRFRLHGADVISRAHPDRQLFDAPVLLMDGYDVYAHLVGKVVSDHAEGVVPWRLEEVSRAGAALPLDPGRLASHLVACGLARAARFVLPRVAALPGGALAREVLARLPSDRVGDAVVAAAGELIGTGGALTPQSQAASHLLNTSLPRGLWSAAAAALGRRIGGVPRGERI